MKTRLTILLIVLVTRAVAHAADSVLQRDLKQLTEQRDKAAAAALDPINRRFQSSLDQLLQRAIQAKDAEAAAKIREALATIGPTAPAKPQLTKAAQERRLDKTAWRETGDAWVSDLRFDDGKMIILPRGGGQKPVAFRIGNDGSINFTWDGKAQQITISEDFAALTWGKYTFAKQ